MVASEHEVYLGFKCLSARPLVTISSSSLQSLDLLTLQDLTPTLFEVKDALHFVSLTWNCEEPGLADQVHEMLKAAAKRLPGHRFIVLASTEIESLYLSHVGVENVLTNCAIFVDERIWNANRAPSSIAKFDACYVARLANLKRHELASEIDRLALVYGNLDMEREDLTRELLPKASFLNRPSKGGQYVYFSHDETRKVLHESAVALCLSAAEGFSRTSIEALLCGLPIVSTLSIGGRERYYHPAYACIVDATPRAVSQAVEDLKSRKLDPSAIRAHVGTLLEFDRQNFVSVANKVFEDVFNARGDLKFEDFRDSIHDFRPAKDFLTS